MGQTDALPRIHSKILLAYVQAKLADKRYDVEGAMSEPMSYDRGSEYATEAGMETSVKADTRKFRLRVVGLAAPTANRKGGK